MKKKITLIVVAVLLIISLVVGLSYAFWRNTFVTTSINKINSSCFSMELTNEKNNIVLESTYPISDEKGRTLTPYSFTITNTCDLFASYTINLEMLEGTTLNSKYIKTMINNEAITNLSTLETANTTVEGATESRVLFKGSLGAGDSTDYTFRLWMDYNTPNNEESMNKNFQSKITVTSEVSTYSPVENGFTNLADALLVNEYQTTNIDVAKNKIANKQEVDTTKTAPIIDWQESKSQSIQTLTVTKADPSIVGSYNIDIKTSQISFGDSYTFDNVTAYYTLNNTQYYDPESIDYSSKDYFFCLSNIQITTNNSLVYYDAPSHYTMYKVVGIESISNSTVQLSSGVKVPTKKYTFRVYKYTEIELENDKSDKGLYESVDDFGTTYFYRGNVNNNYVKFANLYWKVIRINGDGTIRLLYNGTTPQSEKSATTIGYKQYNSLVNDPTYVGYMYSNNLEISYQDTIANDNDSTMKILLDSWYVTNILNKGFSNYIADSGFCNDRSLSRGGGYLKTEDAIYNAYTRMNNNTPTYMCQNISNDLFTLNGNKVGNNKLTYPIGLITIDELSFAGAVYKKLNRLSYVYNGLSYWSMTPYNYSPYSGLSNLSYLGENGNLVANPINCDFYVRPVINLKGDTEITEGIGTVNNPFIIK